MQVPDKDAYGTYFKHNPFLYSTEHAFNRERDNYERDLNKWDIHESIAAETGNPSHMKEARLAKYRALKRGIHMLKLRLEMANQFLRYPEGAYYQRSYYSHMSIPEVRAEIEKLHAEIDRRQLELDHQGFSDSERNGAFRPFDSTPPPL